METKPEYCVCCGGVIAGEIIENTWSSYHIVKQMTGLSICYICRKKAYNKFKIDVHSSPDMEKQLAEMLKENLYLLFLI